jgi:hypothetical protein
MDASGARNMRLLAHDRLGDFGNCGEGMAIQLTGDGRRVLWLTHEWPPKNVTAVDVTEPRRHLSDPFRPEEVAHLVPPAPHDSPRGAVQLNDVFVDERGVVHTVDRFTGGLYILEMRL